MKIRISIAALALLAGCQTVPVSKLWVANTQKDQFTDVETKMVTVGSFYVGGNVYTQAGKYYPFVGVKNGQTYVGIRSGGRYRIPTGTVQIRIDDNVAWTITPEETPADLVPGTAPATPRNAQITADMMASMSKIMSPYTATTGRKAQDILKQMLHGKVLRYRTIGLNQAASTTGEVLLDESLPDALREIGFDPAALL